ncbi:MAG: PilZ domain-containing protein [Elusimicrobia bacterium]|nr:PilZ domain-containing protein [Elusimicrobiota bacterium]
MIHSNGTSKTERRKHARFPVVGNLIEPITLRYAVPKSPGASKKVATSEAMTQPAILTNLSAGGMQLITFLAPPHAKRLDMVLNLPGLDHMPVTGRVVRVHEKGETFVVGIQFIKIPKKHQKRINDMAVDNLDCETRLSLGLPEACVRTCQFHPLCHKPQKAPHWPPRA